MAHGRHSGLWASFLLYSRLERNWAEVLIQDDGCAHPHWDSKASFLAFVPEGQFFPYKALLKKGKRGIPIGWEERGCISSSLSQESLPFNEGSGVDHTSGSNGTGRTTVTLPLKWQHPAVTSSLNLIPFTYFYFLIESFWRTSAKTSWVGGCVFGNLIAILPSTEPTFKMSMMN